MSDDDHLATLSDGAGCAEIWEHLSEQRAAGGSEADEESTANSETANSETADSETADSETADAEAAESADDVDAEQDAAFEAPCP